MSRGCTGGVVDGVSPSCAVRRGGGGFCRVCILGGRKKDLVNENE